MRITSLTVLDEVRRMGLGTELQAVQADDASARAASSEAHRSEEQALRVRATQAEGQLQSSFWSRLTSGVGTLLGLFNLGAVARFLLQRFGDSPVLQWLGRALSLVAGGALEESLGAGAAQAAFGLPLAAATHQALASGITAGGEEQRGRTLAARASEAQDDAAQERRRAQQESDAAGSAFRRAEQVHASLCSAVGGDAPTNELHAGFQGQLGRVEQIGAATSDHQADLEDAAARSQRLRGEEAQSQALRLRERAEEAAGGQRKTAAVLAILGEVAEIGAAVATAGGSAVLGVGCSSAQLAQALFSPRGDDLRAWQRQAEVSDVVARDAEDEAASAHTRAQGLRDTAQRSAAMAERVQTPIVGDAWAAAPHRGLAAIQAELVALGGTEAKQAMQEAGAARRLRAEVDLAGLRSREASDGAQHLEEQLQQFFAIGEAATGLGGAVCGALGSGSVKTWLSVAEPIGRAIELPLEAEQKATSAGAQRDSDRAATRTKAAEDRLKDANDATTAARDRVHRALDTAVALQQNLIARTV